MGWIPNPGSDADAIHDNVAGEIAAVTEKTSPVSADLVLIEDSAASNAKKKVQVGNLPGGGGGALSSDQNVRTAGDVTVNSTATGGVDIDTGLDLVLAAAAGDWIMLGISGRWAAETVSAFIDFYTWDGAAVVNPVGAGLDRTGSARNGLIYGSAVSGRVDLIGGSTLYQVVAGDLVSGNVTFRLRGQTGAATNKTLNATAANPLTVWAVHLG